MHYRIATLGKKLLFCLEFCLHLQPIANLAMIMAVTVSFVYIWVYQETNSEIMSRPMIDFSFYVIALFDL